MLLKFEEYFSVFWNQSLHRMRDATWFQEMIQNIFPKLDNSNLPKLLSNKIYLAQHFFVLVQLKSKERELNAFKALFKQTLSASGNASLSNSNILSQYLNGTTNSSESSSPSPSSASSQQQSTDSTSKGEGSQNQCLSPNQSTSSLNDWSSATNSLSAFLPKI